MNWRQARTQRAAYIEEARLYLRKCCTAGWARVADDGTIHWRGCLASRYAELHAAADAVVQRYYQAEQSR